MAEGAGGMVTVFDVVGVFGDAGRMSLPNSSLPDCTAPDAMGREVASGLSLVVNDGLRGGLYGRRSLPLLLPPRPLEYRGGLLERLWRR